MSSNEQLVLGAVKQKEVSKKQSALQKLFAVWFDAFVYNQIWEDPRVDIEALKIDPQSRILTISSGGCNALNYLVEKPESVTAVDLNRHHIFLLNLKIAAIKHLPAHEEFFMLFGEGRGKENLENYKNYLAQNLDAETRKFWETGSFPGNLLGRRRIDFFDRDGIYEHSRNGYFLRFFHRFARVLGCKTDEVVKAKSISEQEEFFDRSIGPFFDSILIKLIGRMPVTLFGLGIPPQQYAELKGDLEEGGSIIDVYRARAKKLAVEYPIDDNYFAWQAFARKYDTVNRKAIPEYLKSENFESLKAASVNIDTKIGSITEEIILREPGAFNRFVFLDAQDWMNPEVMTELWSAVQSKGEKGSRIIFRTAGSKSPVEERIPAELRQCFEYKPEISRQLFKRDRASIYGGFHLYVLR